MLITKEQQEAFIEKILIDFLIFLNKKGYINDFDFDYEKQIKKFIKKINKSKQQLLKDIIKTNINNMKEEESKLESQQKQLNISDVRERLINYLNGRIRLIQSKYEIDDCDIRIIDEIVEIRTDVENNSF